MAHTDAAQTAELHAIPAFAAWAAARGIRVGDWVWCESEWHKGELLVIDVGPHLVYDDDPCEVPYLRGAIRGDTCGRDVADCRLMASEADLMDYAETLGRVDTSGPWTDEQYKGVEYQAELYLREGPIGGRHVSESATTRIGALVAAVVAMEGGE